VCSFLSRLSIWLSLALVFLATAELFAAPENNALDDVVRQLAARVAAIPNLRGPVRLEFLQEAPFEAETGKEWQQTFRMALDEHHLALTDDASATLLRVGVAETPTVVVLSAAVRVSGKDETRFLSIPRSSFPLASVAVAPIRIARQLVYQTPERILDASWPWNGADGGMILLGYRDSVLSVLRIDPAGKLAQTISLASAGLAPSRDPRGELKVNDANGGTASFGSKVCDLAWSTSTEAKCRSATSNWRGPTVLTPSCDPAGWTLRTDGLDWTTSDVLQVVPAGVLREGSAELRSDFPGPILSVNVGQNPANALVVSKNLRTGNYEIYKVTLACGD